MTHSLEIALGIIIAASVISASKAFYRFASSYIRRKRKAVNVKRAEKATKPKEQVKSYYGMERY